ncbi:MAG: protein translocase subunit SecD, partial [Deltaproteobacteria bacterium]
SSDYADRIKESALEQAIKTVRDRVNSRGIAEPSIVRKGDDIIVELPGLDDQSIERVKTIIKRTAKLEFKIVDNDSEYMKKLARAVAADDRAKELGIEFDTETWVHDESGNRFNDTYLKAKNRTQWVDEAEARRRGCWAVDKPEKDGKFECEITGRQVIEEYLAQLFAEKPELKPDENHQIAYEQLPQLPGATEPPEWRTYYLHRTVELSGAAVSRADVVFNPTTNRPEVLVRFNRWGGRRFGELTSKNVGRKMAIILDDTVSSAPVIQTAITGGSSTITMGGSDIRQIQKEAEDLVAVLRTGSLPAPLREQSESILGPTLGRDAVDKAKFSFLLGSALVVVIMLWVYRTSGMISILALALNLLFMLAVLAALGAELTLPGIAALVLTVGMAVDANIIVYERIRDELRAGKSVRGAVDAGFDRAFTAILDGQLTTAAAGYVLYNYGSGPIQGFATMLLIGIFCTLFTAYWCTRRFFEIYISRRKVIGI